MQSAKDLEIEDKLKPLTAARAFLLGMIDKNTKDNTRAYAWKAYSECRDRLEKSGSSEQSNIEEIIYSLYSGNEFSKCLTILAAAGLKKKE